jgi:hypothetical protein
MTMIAAGVPAVDADATTMIAVAVAGSATVVATPKQHGAVGIAATKAASL